MKIFDLEAGQLKTTADAGEAIASVSWGNDGMYIATGNTDGKVNIWDGITGKMKNELTGISGTTAALVFTPDVQYLIGAGSDNKIIVWNLELWMVNKETPAHTGGISSLAINDKGTILVSAGGDGAIKIWDLAQLKIGKKKVIKQEFAPEIVCSPINLSEANNNGIIEVSDNPSFKIIIDNKGKGTAYDVTVKVSLETMIKGFSIEKEIRAGNLEAGKGKEVTIPVKVDDKLESASGTIIAGVTEANGHNPSPVRLNFQTKGGESYSYIAILEHSYTSASGKAEIGAPITMKIKLQNASKGEAKNIKVNYIFPPHVMAVDRVTEVIPLIKADESKEVSVQFYADKEFKAAEMKIGFSIDGAFTNANDMIFSVKMNAPLPSSMMLAAVDAAEVEKVLYRGSSDPLKGLNVSKAKSMQFGNYYALVIAIDKYKGTWTPLQNAVNDAKAVEKVLNAKYKIDHLKSLYNEQATREKIIQEFEWLVSNVKENDNLFIYYSGHGEYKKELSKGYWVPVDAETASTSKYISNSDIQTFLGGIKTKHTLLVADACFSGDIFRGGTVSIPFEDSEKYYTEVYNQSSRQALTSGGIEPVMDGGKEGHSVFAYYFLKTLENNNTKYLDAGQLYNQIKIPIINNSEQTPKIAPIKNTGDEGGQFLFIKK